MAQINSDSKVIVSQRRKETPELYNLWSEIVRRHDRLGIDTSVYFAFFRYRKYDHACLHILSVCGNMSTFYRLSDQFIEHKFLRYHHNLLFIKSNPRGILEQRNHIFYRFFNHFFEIITLAIHFFIVFMLNHLVDINLIAYNRINIKIIFAY